MKRRPSIRQLNLERGESEGNGVELRHHFSKTTAFFCRAAGLDYRDKADEPPRTPSAQRRRSGKETTCHCVRLPVAHEDRHLSVPLSRHLSRHDLNADRSQRPKTGRAPPFTALIAAATRKHAIPTPMGIAAWGPSCWYAIDQPARIWAIVAFTRFPTADSSHVDSRNR